MKATTLLTTSLLFYLAEAQQLVSNWPNSIGEWPNQYSPHIHRPLPINVSQTEFETKMKEYQRVTRGTEQQREYQPIVPTETHHEPDGGVTLKFSSPHFKVAEGITLKVLISNATHVTIIQTMANGHKVVVKTMFPPSAPLWVDAYLHPSTEINVRISCGHYCKVQYPTANVQYTIGHGSRDLGINSEGNLMCSGNAQPHDACCMTKFKVKFEELEQEGLEPIFAPLFYDASYCGNFYCDTHPPHYYTIIKNHLLYNPADPPESECSPSAYQPLRVLTVHPDNSEILVVQVWEKAVAKTCGCV
uniref:TGF-beta family profile domain-containing protein n=1 Tax=Lygus hesperus TaxID=30085 RepID=A0A0K8SSH0_LYGHE